MAASFCLTVGAEDSRPASSIHAATCSGCTWGREATPALSHQAEKLSRGPGVGAPGVRIADLRGKEFEEPHAGAVAGGRDQAGRTGAVLMGISLFIFVSQTGSP